MIALLTLLVTPSLQTTTTRTRPTSWCRRGSSSAGRGRARAGSMEYRTLSGCGHCRSPPAERLFDGMWQHAPTA
jgi:hypothetical protein